MFAPTKGTQYQFCPFPPLKIPDARKNKFILHINNSFKPINSQL